MDDAKRRAAQFNAEERIAELEAEVARLRRALEEIRDLDPDSDYATFFRESSRIAMLALASKAQRAKGWQLEQAKQILKLYQEGKMGLVTQADIDKIFADLDDDSEVLKLVDSLADDAAAHPEKLGDVGELIKGDDEQLKP